MKAVIFILAMAAPFLPGADWPQFRGPEGASTSADTDLPLSFGEKENVAFRVDLPGRGVSGPIVVRGRVVVTASSGFRQDRLHVLCFDAAAGGKLWERQFWSTGRTMCHPKTCMAAPTPASDGERIFAFYSTNDLFCLDLEGNLLWLRGLTHDYPNASNSIGMASSPLVLGEIVVVQVENATCSFAAGLDARTGENIWKIERPRKPSWSTPVVLGGKAPGEDVILLESWEKLSGHDPATGRELWAWQKDCNCIPSCAVVGDTVFLPSSGLTVLRPEKGSEVPKLLWQSARSSLAMASPVVLEGKVYTVNGAGVLACAEASSGQILWQLRLKGPISSTPVAAGGHLYLVNEEGLVQVVKLGEKGEVAGTGELKETILGSPAISGGAIFLRSDAHLWKFSREKSPGS